MSNLTLFRISNQIQRLLKGLLVAALAIILTACSDDPKPNQIEIKTDEAPNVVEKGSAEHIRQATNISDNDLDNSNQNYGDWLSHGRNYQEDRYSKLDQISPKNIKNLGLAWALEIGTKRGIQATPIVVDGIMFFTAPWSVVYAVDARKGEVIWKYDPKVPKTMAKKLCCGVVNRGVALYQGAVISATLDGRLLSIDAATGKLNWSVMTVPKDEFYSITGAPRVVNGNIIIGNGGAEFSARGFVTAYNATTGKKVWRFYTVPGDPQKPFEHPDLKAAAKTWTGSWWKKGGGGTVWDSIVHDPELNLVYIGVGNGSPWNRDLRSPEGGDNLYLSSIVALDADTGAYRWHYQTTPGDTWDYTATQHIILADLVIDGKLRQVLMQAPKNGFFYVIDRKTGEFISGDNFVYQNWTSGLDENGRPIEKPGARYQDGKAHWIAPSSHGGHNWLPMSYNHTTGLVYIPAAIQSEAYANENQIFNNLGANVSLNGKLYRENVFDPKAPLPGSSAGRLIAYDPIKHEEVWGVEQSFLYNGGLLSTENGLLMQGDAEGKFRIRDAATGDVLWEFDVRSGAVAAPVTYMVDGEQYISLLVGWGGFMGQTHKRFERLHQGTLYTWKIGGLAESPIKNTEPLRDYTRLTTDASALTIGRGFDHYVSNCAPCHALGEGGGSIPDLTRSHEGIFEIYSQIITQGALASQGMPSFEGILDEKDAADIKAFILYFATEMHKKTPLSKLIPRLAGMQKMSDDNEAKLKPLKKAVSK